MSGDADDRTTILTDDELVTSWGVIVDSLTRTQNRILQSVEAAGVPAQWFTVLHVLLAAEGHRLPMGRLAAELSIASPAKASSIVGTRRVIGGLSMPS